MVINYFQNMFLLFLHKLLHSIAISYGSKPVFAQMMQLHHFNSHFGDVFPCLL